MALGFDMLATKKYFPAVQTLYCHAETGDGVIVALQCT